MELSFPARYRIRRPADFDRAYRLRQRASDEVLLVFGFPNGLEITRLGLSVSRKVGGAVERQRWKRRIREAFRCQRHELPVGLDLIVLPKAHDHPPFKTLASSLAKLTRQVAYKLSGQRR